MRFLTEGPNMSGHSRGFTLIELMIVVVVIGIIASIALPNFASMRDLAREGGVKANMHTLQLAIEDYGVENAGRYPSVIDANHLVNVLPGSGASFRNPYTNLPGDGSAWADRASFAADGPAVSGLVTYADSLNVVYNVKGHGTHAPMSLVLTAGQ